MASRRSQIKQQIARTEDPVIRMQLQELLDGKRQRRNKGIRKIEEIFDSVSRHAVNKLSSSALRVLMLIFITIILLIIYMVLESGA